MTHIKSIWYTIGVFYLSILLLGCGLQPIEQTENEVKKDSVQDVTISKVDGHLLHDYLSMSKDGLVNVVVEIPTGTVEKWEVDKVTGKLALEMRNGEQRKVAYLGYPGNYGMVPQTLLPEEQGGDGDPLDVLILGPAIGRGALVPCKIVGMLELLDGGEQDDKLIAVRANTIFEDIDGLEELNAKFPGIADIVQIWFENYKGRGVIETISFRDKEIAEEVLDSAIRAYEEWLNSDTHIYKDGRMTVKE